MPAAIGFLRAIAYVGVKTIPADFINGINLGFEVNFTYHFDLNGIIFTVYEGYSLRFISIISNGIYL